MSVNDISTAFVKEFESEVHEAYQRMGSRLRPMVRNKMNAKGGMTYFPAVTKLDAGTKSRNERIDTVNVDHSMTECTLRDYYVGSWLDALDELKIEHDERQVLVNAGAYALGRKTDELIVAALNSVTSGGSATTQKAGGSDGRLTLEKVLRGFEILGAGEVPEDGDRYAIVGWRQWSDLLQIDQFADADYVGADELPWGGAQAKRWLGTMWVPVGGLPKGSGRRTCFWFHKSAVGLACGQEIKSDISWHGDRAAYFINNMMSQGAALIDPKGVVYFACSES